MATVPLATRSPGAPRGGLKPYRPLGQGWCFNLAPDKQALSARPANPELGSVSEKKAFYSSLNTQGSSPSPKPQGCNSSFLEIMDADRARREARRCPLLNPANRPGRQTGGQQRSGGVAPGGSRAVRGNIGGGYSSGSSAAGTMPQQASHPTAARPSRPSARNSSSSDVLYHPGGSSLGSPFGRALLGSNPPIRCSTRVVLPYATPLPTKPFVGAGAAFARIGTGAVAQPPFSTSAPAAQGDWKSAAPPASATQQQQPAPYKPWGQQLQEARETAAAAEAASARHHARAVEAEQTAQQLQQELTAAHAATRRAEAFTAAAAGEASSSITLLLQQLQQSQATHPSPLGQADSQTCEVGRLEGWLLELQDQLDSLHQAGSEGEGERVGMGQGSQVLQLQQRNVQLLERVQQLERANAQLEAKVDQRGRQAQQLGDRLALTEGQMLKATIFQRTLRCLKRGLAQALQQQELLLEQAQQQWRALQQKVRALLPLTGSSLKHAASDSNGSSSPSGDHVPAQNAAAPRSPAASAASRGSAPSLGTAILLILVACLGLAALPASRGSTSHGSSNGLHDSNATAVCPAANLTSSGLAAVSQHHSSVPPVGWLASAAAPAPPAAGMCTQQQLRLATPLTAVNPEEQAAPLLGGVRM